MESKNLVLKWKDYLKISFRSFLLQSSFNYGSYQGVGYAYTIFPALQKIYKNNENMLKESTLANIEFYNTNPQVLPFITNLHLAMLDGGQSIDDARSIKMALMGPFGGLGGSLFKFGLAPLFASIGATIAGSGMILGPILFFLCINACLVASKIITGYYGYKLGTSALDTLNEKMASISRAATIVGITVISGLSVTFIKLELPFKYITEMPNGEISEIAVETVLDKITPKLLPALYLLIIYRLVSKHNWTTYKLIVLTIVFGILGSVFGFLA